MPIHREIAKSNFDPATVAVLVEAYECVCRILELSGKRQDRLTAIVARHIIEIGREGESDPMRICARALNELGLNPDGHSSPLM